jgi:hypothetical protein
MKQLTILLLMFAVRLSAQSDDALVRETIETAYVGGIHNGGSIESIRRGFHPNFVMFRLNKNEILSVTLEEWIQGIEKNRASGSTADGPKARAEYRQVQVIGTSANASLDLYRGDQKIFTDHLLLYKFAEGWRIVSKSFYRHP